MRINFLTWLIILMIGMTHESLGQSVELTPFSGYTFSSSFPIYRGNAKVYGGHTFGGELGVGIRDNLDLVLFYSQQNSRVYANSTEFTEPYDEDLNTHYIMAGGYNTGNISGNLYYYGGVRLGAVIFTAPQDNSSDDVTKFAAAGTLGLKHYFSDRVGLKIGANLSLPMVNTGASLWWGVGSGPQVGISSWSPLVQFNLTGGLVFVLK